MEVVFYIGIVLVILFGPWVLVWRVNRRRKRERLEDQSRWASITQRVYGLERELRELKERGPQPASADSGATVKTDAETPPPAVAPAAPAVQPSIPSPSIRVPVSEKPVSTRPADETPLRAIPYSAIPSSNSAVAPPPRAPSSTVAPVPTFSTAQTGPSMFERFKSLLDIEEMLGTDWLNKVGIAFIVLGIAFFLSYELRTMGPAGKVLVGILTSAAMLAAGIWAERADRYRILARAGIGGGWALLFFTTYAMYHVPAAHVLDSQPLDLVLMLVVAAAMVAHTLRYRSQVVTGLAFLLAFLTVTISHSNVYSLSAGVVLAGALVVIVGRMQWFELELFGILASYLNHFLWVRPVIEAMHGKRHAFPEFLPSAAILVLYWLIYRMSYVLRTPSDSRQERISTAAALVNTSLLLALLKYQSVHPEWAFWALLALGAVEVLLGQLGARKRRTALIVLSTLGVVLLIAAFPFRYSGARLSVLWLAEAEALLLIGVWTKEIVFRRLGILASILVAGQMIAYDAAAIFGRRMDGADLRPDYPLAVLFAVAMTIFYFNAHWVLPRWAGLFTAEFDRRVMRRLTYAGAVMLLIGAWLAFPESWTAVAWCALGLGLLIIAGRIGSAELRYQGAFLAAISVIRVLAINLQREEKFHELTLRLITMSIVGILLYVTSRWGRSADAPAWSFDRIAGEGYPWAGSLLLSLLAWYELRAIGVADAWVIGGLILLELGIARKNLSLRLQSYVALVAGFLRIFFVNLNAAGLPGEISPRFYTVVPITLAFFYAYRRLGDGAVELRPTERKWRFGEIACWMGTISVGSLMRFELEADWVATAWAALAFALFAIAWRSGRRVFLHQGLFVVAGVLFRTVLHNFYERSYFPAPKWESRWITVGATIVLLLMSLPVAFQLRKKDGPSDAVGIRRLFGGLGRHPEQLLFFIAVGLLTALLGIEMRHGMVTLSWGLEGVGVFLLALWLGERSFRLTGLGLLMLCVAKILVQDVWRLNIREKFLTFFVLGVALVSVSFLWTRYRERIREFL